MRALSLALVFATVLAPSFARGTAPPADVPLTLAEARARALEKNVELRVERENVAVAESVEGRAKGAYDPTLRADARWRDRTDPVNSILSGAPTGDLAPNYSGYVANLGISQLLPTGGTVAFTTTTARDETTNVFSILSPSWSTSIGLELRQPLLRNLSVDPARQGLRVARVDRSRSAASLARVTAETVAAVERAFWSLLAARQDAEARQSAVALAERQKADVGARVEAGTLSEADLAAPVAELERRKGDLYASREAASRAENALKSLLLADPADPALVVSPRPGRRAEGPRADSARRRRGPRLGDGDSDPRSPRPRRGSSASPSRTRRPATASARSSTSSPPTPAAGSRASRTPGSRPRSPIDATEIPDAIDGGLGRSWGTVGEGRFPDASVGLALTRPARQQGGPRRRGGRPLRPDPGRAGAPSGTAGRRGRGAQRRRRPRDGRAAARRGEGREGRLRDAAAAPRRSGSTPGSPRASSS